MNPLASEFYRSRDQRTEECIPGGLDYEAQIHVAADRASVDSAAGQVLLMSLLNQLARVFRHITVDVPDDTPNLLHALTPEDDLQVAVLHLVRRIDPFGEFSLGPAPSRARMRIGIGGPKAPCDWYLGADRAIATLDRKPTTLTSEHAGTVRGACLASCLGAATAIREIIGQSPVPRRLSVWNYMDGELAAPGPTGLDPVNVGRVLLVGAGAVASSLVYWLGIMGVAGEWVVVDADRVALHNTNRSLLFFPEDAGWPDGRGQFKAELLADALPGGRAVTKWYDECEGSDLFWPDVILPLANDRGVRARIASRNHVVVLHATTSRHWFSQLHRHVTGRDDCLACRLPENQVPVFACSTGPTTSAEAPGPSADAALPFLSAASGLMLATGLQRLQAGKLVLEPWNDWRWHFDTVLDHMAARGVRTCSKTCGTQISPSVRRQLNAECRWAGLDPEKVAV
jgi:hypothetical protein